MLDWTACLGTALGLLAIVGGQWLEGGALGQITQPVALWIVLGGTLGAVFLSFPKDELWRAFGCLPRVYFHEALPSAAKIEELVELATLARREGLLILEAKRSETTDPMLAKAMGHIVDGIEPEVLREVLEVEIDSIRRRDEAAARVFEVAGGYAPTIGILGAVLGLIQVMARLNDPSKIGEGIAVAFVATIYGVAIANLMLLPWANKLK